MVRVVTGLVSNALHRTMTQGHLADVIRVRLRALTLSPAQKALSQGTY
jgi:hypothetical protein